MLILCDGTTIECTGGYEARKRIVGMEEYKTIAMEITARPVQVVPAKDLLYIGQREFAVTIPEKAVRFVGSEDATTCHIAVFRHTGSGAIALAHMDGAGTEDGVNRIVDKIVLLNGCEGGSIELHLFGGFVDDNGTSIKVGAEILDAVIKRKEKIHLKTACVTELNDVIRQDVHYPIIYGIGVDVDTGEFVPATFPDKGPDIPLRSANISCAKIETLLEIYDVESDQIRIDPVDWNEMPDVFEKLQLPPEEILKMSTSPAQEPPYFVENMRNSWEVIYNNPKPDETLFPNNKPRSYGFGNGWGKIV